jgi:hypothetical protein
MIANTKTPMFFPLSSGICADAASPAEKALVPAAWPSGIAQFGTSRTSEDGEAARSCDDRRAVKRPSADDPRL